MKKEPRDLYFVAVKIFLERGGKLFIFKDRFGEWDIPGGRIQKHEFEVPLEKVVARKIHEELGLKIKYRLGSPLVFMRHERREASLGKRVRIFAVGYVARMTGGTIQLSPQHIKSEWVVIKSFKPKEYFRDGWLKGVTEYLRLKRK